MRAIPLVGSVLAHALLLGAIALARLRAPGFDAPPPPPASTVATPEPVDVILLDDAPASAPEPATRPPASPGSVRAAAAVPVPVPVRERDRARPVAALSTSAMRVPPMHGAETAAAAARTSAAMSASLSDPASGAASGSGAGEPAGSGAAPARSGPRGRLAMRDYVADPFGGHEYDPAGTPPPDIHRSGRLRTQPGGRAVVDDAVTTATVARDGSISFHDKPNIDMKFHIPAIPTPSGIIRGVRDAGKPLGEWYADPYAQTRYGKTQDLPEHLQATPDSCQSYGDVLCDDANAPDVEKKAREDMRGKIGLGGNFDLTAAIMKWKHVGDPFASRKLKLLDETRDERVERGTQFRGDQLAASAQIMRKHLEEMWATTADAAARREALFELWDDCAEGEGPTGEAGGRARAMVVGWIGEHLPAGSAGAYSPSEIARLSARRTSTTAFDPYGAAATNAIAPPAGVGEH